MTTDTFKIKKRVKEDGGLHESSAMWIADFLLVSLSATLIFLLKLDPWTVLSKLGLMWFGLKLTSLYVTPDLDLNHSRPKRHWGGLGFLWMPYQRIIAQGHRSLLSHGINVPKKWRRYPSRVFLVKCFGWTIGTVVRSLYLLSIVLIVLFSIDWMFDTNIFVSGFFRVAMNDVWLYVWMGTFVSDFLHVRVVDTLTSKR